MQEATIKRTISDEEVKDYSVVNLVSKDEARRREKLSLNMQIDLEAKKEVHRACLDNSKLFIFEPALSKITACEMRGSLIYRQSNMLDKRYFNDARPDEQEVLIEESEAIADFGDTMTFLDRFDYLKARRCFRAVPLVSQFHVGKWFADEKVESELEGLRQKCFYEPIEEEISVGTEVDEFLLFTTKKSEHISEDRLSDIYLKTRQSFALNLADQPGVKVLIDEVNRLDDVFERLLGRLDGYIKDKLWEGNYSNDVQFEGEVNLSPDFISEFPELSEVLIKMEAQKTKLAKIVNKRIEVLFKQKDESIIPISTEVRLRHDLKKDYSEKSAHNKVASFSLGQAGLLKAS